MAETVVPEDRYWETAVDMMDDSNTLMGVPVRILATAEFASAWCAWCRHRVTKGRPLTYNQVRLQIRRLEKRGLQKALKLIRSSIAKNQTWLGSLGEAAKKLQDVRGGF